MDATNDILVELFGEDIGSDNIELRMKLTIVNGIDYAIESEYEIQSVDDWLYWG